MRPNEVLAIPEIVQGVLDCMPHEVLFNCLFVNKLWFSEASRKLWDRVIEPELLDRIEDGDRAQYYANLTTGLTYDGPGFIDQKGKRVLKFPGLRTLSIDSKKIASPGIQFWEPYLGPCLTVIHFYGGPAGDEFLDKLVTDCPNLTEILIDAPMHATAAGLARLAANCRARKLLLCYGLSHCFDSQVFMAAASNEHIEELTIPETDEHTLDQIKEHVREPFKFLQTFNCVSEVSSKIVPKFLTMMPRLVNISLERIDSVHSVLTTIVDRAVGLTSLRIAGTDSAPTASTLKAVSKRFPSLRDFEISIIGGDFDPNDCIDNACIHEFTKQYPLLTDLTLRFMHKITCPGLLSIGQNCRQLQGLDIFDIHSEHRSMVIDEELMRRQSVPLFPNVVAFEPELQLFFLSDATRYWHFPLLDLDY